MPKPSESIAGISPSDLVPARLLPSIEKRMDGFYNGHVKKTWLGGSIIYGKIATPSDVHLYSNDYLSLYKDPRMVMASMKALVEFGNGAVMSGIYLQEETPFVALEQQLVDFCQGTSGVICQSGYDANLGLIQCIGEKGQPVYMDMLAHMSLWDGCKLTGANIIKIAHNDLDSLELRINRNGPGIVVVDAIYSITGEIAPIKKLVEICEKHHCTLVVDESHSLGTHGPNGAGLVVDLGLQHQVQFRTASLAKAFAGRGGLVISNHSQFSKYYKFTSGPAIFSSTLLPADIAWFSEAIRVISQEEGRRSTLSDKASYVQAQLTEQGYNLNGSQSQIITIEPGPATETIRVRDILEDHGIFGSIFMEPATTPSRSIIRFSLNSAVSDSEITRLVEVCKKIRDQIKLKDWSSTKRLSRDNALRYRNNQIMP
ncbi:MAG: quorum-sensing autoinducer CAI-1 synthase [Gammaproteobacteria bacterium]|nr:quorum-sensing autoinducer CAI-1 synthase [Gammaproteobacteria bacterium]